MRKFYTTKGELAKKMLIVVTLIKNGGPEPTKQWWLKQQNNGDNGDLNQPTKIEYDWTNKHVDYEKNEGVSSPTKNSDLTDKHDTATAKKIPNSVSRTV